MEIEKSDQYYLSQTFKSHDTDARCVHVQNNMMISGSNDKKINIYDIIDNSRYEHRQTINYLEDYIYSVRVRKSGGFIVGCKDTKIYIFDNEGNPMQQLEGHTGPVNCVQELDDGNIISGSWDGTAKQWDLESGACTKSFEGQSYAVALLPLPQLETLVTGSQDRHLRFFDLETAKIKKMVKDAHNDIIRELCLVDDIGFLSASNDQVVKLWTFEGDLIQELRGHQAFVFSVQMISFGKYVSGADDNSIKLWLDDTCTQTICHPGSVWSISINQKNNDIITGCSDGHVRVFTNDPTRKADQDQIDMLEQASQLNLAKGPEGLDPAEVQKLAPVSDLNLKKGKKEGEIRLFRDGNTPIAYMWKMGDQSWEKIGDVIGGGGEGGKMRKYYQGDKYFEAREYDYVFDVQDDSGIPKLLPYNEDDNPLEVSEKYCAREGLSKSFTTQIREFLRQNTKSGLTQNRAKAKQNVYEQAKSQDLSQPFKSDFFPLFQNFTFTNMNIEGLKKKVEEFNEKLLNSAQESEKLQGKIKFPIGLFSQINLGMNEKELKLFQKILLVLSQTNMYHSSKLEYNEMELLTHKLLKWPIQYMLPVFDLYRLFSLHPQCDQIFSQLDGGLWMVAKICYLMDDNNTPDVTVNLCLKIICNMYAQTGSKYCLANNYVMVFESLKKISQNRQNNNVQDFLSQVLANFSIDFSQRINYLDQKQIIALCSILINNLLKAQDENIQLKYLVAIGNMLLANKGLCIGIMGRQINDFKPAIGKSQDCYNDIQNLLARK